jgi:hypothetical protein
MGKRVFDGRWRRKSNAKTENLACVFLQDSKSLQ